MYSTNSINLPLCSLRPSKSPFHRQECFPSVKGGAFIRFYWPYLHKAASCAKLKSSHFNFGKTKFVMLFIERTDSSLWLNSALPMFEKQDLFFYGRWRSKRFPHWAVFRKLQPSGTFLKTQFIVALSTVTMRGKHFEKPSSEKQCFNVTRRFQQARTLMLNSSVIFCHFEVCHIFPNQTEEHFALEWFSDVVAKTAQIHFCTDLLVAGYRLSFLT